MSVLLRLVLGRLSSVDVSWYARCVFVMRLDVASAVFVCLSVASAG